MSLDALRNLTDIGLFVTDIERAVAFYGTTLGFELKRRDIGFAEFHTGGVGLALWEVSDVTKALALGGYAASRLACDGCGSCRDGGGGGRTPR